MSPGAGHNSELEVWCSVAGFEGLYDVSTLGRVRSLWCSAARHDGPRRTPLILKANGRYPQVVLVRDRVKHPTAVHVLVLETFVGPAPDGMEAAHEDGNSRNPALSNLAWKTHQANVADKLRHGTHQCGERQAGAKLTRAAVAKARELYVPRSRTHGAPALARLFGVSKSAMHMVIANQHWVGLAMEEGAAS